MGQPKFKLNSPYIASAVFSRNLEMLSEYLIATRSQSEMNVNFFRRSEHMNDKELQQKMIESQNFISARAIHPDTHLIYGKVNLADPQWWKNTVFPSPESIKNRFCDDSETPQCLQLRHNQW